MVKLQAAKCPQCGADIEVNVNLEKTICQYCGSTILIEDAVQKIKIEHSGTVKVDGIKNRDDYLKQAKKHMKVEEYEKAIELLKIIVRDDKFDIEAYSDMIKSYVGIIKRDNLNVNCSKYNSDHGAVLGLSYLEQILTIDKRLMKIDENNEREKYLGKTIDDINSYQKMISDRDLTKERREEILNEINQDMEDAYTNECVHDFFKILNETMKSGTFNYSTSRPELFEEYTFDGYFGGRRYLSDAIGAKDIDEIEKRFSDYESKISPLLSKATNKHNKKVKVNEAKRKSKFTIGLISLIFSILVAIGVVLLNIEALHEGIITLVFTIFLLDSWLVWLVLWWMAWSWDTVRYNKKTKTK